MLKLWRLAALALMCGVLVGLPTVAYADCEFDENGDVVGCEDEDESEDPGAEGGGGGGGGGTCSYQGLEIPCTWESATGESIGTWSPDRACYVKAVNLDENPWIEPDDPVWEGNYPEGAIYQCTHVSFNEGCIPDRSCGYGNSGIGDMWWAPEPPVAEPVDPMVLVERALAEMQLQPISAQMAPPPLSASAASQGLVGLPVWMWSDPSDNTWGPISRSESEGSVFVDVTARVEKVEWDMGDGSVPVVCETPGTAFNPAVHTVDDTPDCGHVYYRTSGDQPDGSYTVTATSYWVAEWETSDGPGDPLEFELETQEELVIAEMQAIRIR